MLHCFILLLAQFGPVHAGSFPGFTANSKSQELTITATLEHGVRFHINAPSTPAWRTDQPVTLIVYGLPNGNTIEQTIGKTMKPGDDWHFDIQHIGAQTRFMRDLRTNENLVVAYLENDLKSWPAWRRQHGDEKIPTILETVRKPFGHLKTRLVLTGHSGGGSFTFGYLNTLEAIPGDVERIAFLDSNYAYETGRHRDKLAAWLKSSRSHFLVVLAYHDNIALLNGKTFVSAEGGTWGRSHLMKKDFEDAFSFSEKIFGEMKHWSALEGRVQFFMKENPEKKILHTVQVERNGFIHAMLAGTPLENRGYTYFGERAYTRFIRDE